MKRGLNQEQRYYLGLLKRNKYHGGIFAAYKNPSECKIEIYEKITRECWARDGYGLSVLTANCSFFTVGYFYPDPTTGELRARIELPSRTLDFAVVE